MLEPLNEHARAWLASGKEMDSEYAQMCLEYIEALEKEIEQRTCDSEVENDER